MLQVQQLQLQLGHHVILQDISFDTAPGSLSVIIGQNGSGKSSLLRCLSGWQVPTSGGVLYNEKSLYSVSSKERAALVSFLPQRPQLSESIPVIDIIAASRYRFFESHKKSRSVAQSLLERFDLMRFHDKDWYTLSGGEAQRVALLCLHAQDAKTWLLDEPANHLDPSVQRQIYSEIVQEWQKERTVVLVTHNINLILGAVPRTEYHRVHIIGMQEGKIDFIHNLSEEKLLDRIGGLYRLPIQRINVFGREQFVFGVPE